MVSGQAVAAIHEHSNYKHTVGMGELVAVLNGVEFRTRHNDYKMRMPSRNSTVYGATEDVPYPDVPPQVDYITSLCESLYQLTQREL